MAEPGPLDPDAANPQGKRTPVEAFMSTIPSPFQHEYATKNKILYCRHIIMKKKYKKRLTAEKNHAEKKVLKRDKNSFSRVS